MTPEIEPDKSCATCSLLCMRVDQIVDKQDKQEAKLEDLQRRLTSMEVRISTVVSIVIVVTTIVSNYVNK